VRDALTTLEERLQRELEELRRKEPALFQPQPPKEPLKAPASVQPWPPKEPLKAPAPVQTQPPPKAPIPVQLPPSGSPLKGPKSEEPASKKPQKPVDSSSLGGCLGLIFVAALPFVGYFFGQDEGRKKGREEGKAEAERKWREEYVAEQQKLRRGIAAEFRESAACLYSPWMLSRIVVHNWEQKRQEYDFSECRRGDFLEENPVRNKSAAAVGKDFEKTVANDLIYRGYQVIHTGGLYGLKDLGRDLLARKPETGQTLVVQCKRWRAGSRITPQVLFYLFATSVLYAMKVMGLEINDVPFRNGEHEDALKILSEAKVVPVLVSTAPLSAIDADLAATLGVMVTNNILLDKRF
jgi:hypothetical protein